MAASPIEVESSSPLKFSVLTDGTVRGDDGQDGRLASSLRYAARLAAQIEFLLEVGALEELATISERAITAGVTRDDAGGIGLSVVMDSQAFRQPQVLTVVGGADVHAALAHCVRRVQQTPGVRWCAIIADDKRVVGASLPQAGAAVLASVSALPNVGVRALAVLDSIEEPLRESWVRLTYEHATVLLASIETHCVYAVTDGVGPGPFGEAIDEVRAILSPYDLSQAATLATQSNDESIDEVPDGSVEPVLVASGPAPAGMRYRAVRPKAPKQPRQSRRGLFGR